MVRLIGSLDGWLKDWLILDANTGLRVSTLLAIRWADVNLPANQLTVPNAIDKSKRTHVIPLTPAAREVLERRKREAIDSRPETAVFANPRTGKPYLRGTVQKRIPITDRRQFLIGSARRSRGSVLIRNQAMRKGRPVAFPDVRG